MLNKFSTGLGRLVPTTDVIRQILPEQNFRPEERTSLVQIR
jgi:hypothetical protein